MWGNMVQCKSILKLSGDLEWHVQVAFVFAASRCLHVMLCTEIVFGLTTRWSGSALTGTGGPVLLLPILMFANVPALAAIGVSQAIQLPIAIFATAGFLLFGSIDIELGVQLGLIMAVGVIIGAQIAHKVSASQLRKLVAIALVVVGLLMIVRTLTIAS